MAVHGAVAGANQRSRRKLPSQRKAKEIAQHGEVRGKPLTKRQRGFFGLLAGGEKPSKMRPRRPMKRR